MQFEERPPVGRPSSVGLGNSAFLGHWRVIRHFILCSLHITIRVYSTWPKAVPLLVLSTLLVYANCVNKTMLFDDDAWIVDNPKLDTPIEYLESIEGRPL